MPDSTRVWRRGPAPVPASAEDPGYFGPGSVIWDVVLNPVTVVMAGQTTALIEAAHRGMQAVMLGHDPAIRAALNGRGDARQTVRRLQRTVGVPVPMILGSRPTADHIAAHLRGVHSRMAGTVPGTEDESYAAAGPDLVVFAHVTIFHAFLRNYEALAFAGGRPIGRLPGVERDRYFAELVAFGELMGAPAGMVPDSVAAVADYYASLTGAYGQVPGYRAAQLRAAIATLRPGSLRELPWTGVGAALDASFAVALGVIPRPVRRLLGVPALLDRALDAALTAVRPSFAPLAVPAIGDHAVEAVAGPDALRLVRAARRLTVTADGADQRLAA